MKMQLAILKNVSMKYPAKGMISKGFRPNSSDKAPAMTANVTAGTEEKKL